MTGRLNQGLGGAATSYVRIVGFEAFEGVVVDADEISRSTERLMATIASGTGPDHATAMAVLLRAAAIETGAIEDLYALTPGTTMTIAKALPGWERALSDEAPGAESQVKALMESYEEQLVAQPEDPITEASLRATHSSVCSGQETYEVRTGLGRQMRSLPKGAYKEFPNNVLTRSGRAHSYCPVEETGSEMSRLVRELNGTSALEAHPILRAAYAAIRS